MRGHRIGLRHAASHFGFAFEPLSRNPDGLEPEHPFARALDLLRVLLRQSLAAAAVLVVAVSGVALGAEWARLLLVPAAIVELGVDVALAAAAAVACERADDLIAEGRGELPLPLLARQRRRLLDRRRRIALAEGFEDLVRAAARWRKTLPGYRPVFNIRLVRQVAPDMLEIAALLRADITDARGVALAKRLLTNGSSPLYGVDIDELSDATWRIRNALSAPRA